MRRTHLEAVALLRETGDETAAWELAQQDDGLLPETTRDQWLSFARGLIAR